jgi:geranylgeranyl pyrophosphate synthase
VSDVLESTLTEWRAAIDAELARVPDPGFEMPPALREAIRYSVSGGGKRMRGLLFMAAYEAVGGTGDAVSLAASIEIVHAYSLVHDDLPCMDNDSMRRGLPTTHRAHGVAVATVAGVAMVPLAVRQAVEGCRRLDMDDTTTARIVARLMAASGAGGMVGGQLLDLLAENTRLSMPELEQVHRGKTGALLTASFVIAGLAARAPAPTIEALTDSGDALGLAFQIADDVLDATSSSATLGKTAGSDAAMAKSTYVSLLGVAEARARAESLIEQGMRRLDEHGLRTIHLERLARFIAARRS